MRTGLILIAVTLLALFGAVKAVAAEDTKVGAVNVQRTLNEVEQGKRAKAALKAEFDAKQRKVVSQQEELKQMQAQLEKDAAVLSKDALMAKQKTFNDKFVELQRNMASYRDELVAKEAKMTSQIIQNVKTIVADIAQKEGFTLVVETSQDAVLFAKSKEDLTSKVVSAYNQRFSGPLKIE